MQELPPIWSNMASGAFLSPMMPLGSPPERQVSEVWVLFDKLQLLGRAKDA